MAVELAIPFALNGLIDYTNKRGNFPDGGRFYWVAIGADGQAFSLTLQITTQNPESSVSVLPQNEAEYSESVNGVGEAFETTTANLVIAHGGTIA